MFRCTRADIDEALTATCRMALAELTISPAGYEIRTSRETLTLAVSPRGRAFELVFRGPWRDVRKAVLIRKLIAKQFEPLVPRLRIRLRGSAGT